MADVRIDSHATSLGRRKWKVTVIVTGPCDLKYSYGFTGKERDVLAEMEHEVQAELDRWKAKLT